MYQIHAAVVVNFNRHLVSWMFLLVLQLYACIKQNWAMNMLNRVSVCSWLINLVIFSHCRNADSAPFRSIMFLLFFVCLFFSYTECRAVLLKTTTKKEHLSLGTRKLDLSLNLIQINKWPAGKSCWLPDQSPFSGGSRNRLVFSQGLSSTGQVWRSLLVGIGGKKNKQFPLSSTPTPLFFFFFFSPSFSFKHLLRLPQVHVWALGHPNLGKHSLWIEYNC